MHSSRYVCIHRLLKGLCTHILPTEFCITTHSLYHPKILMNIEAGIRGCSTEKFKINEYNKNSTSFHISVMEQHGALVQIKTHFYVLNIVAFLHKPMPHIFKVLLPWVTITTWTATATAESHSNLRDNSAIG